jgi:hypothetical protein
MEEFISSFEHLALKMKGMHDAFFWECFINGLKDEIRAQVLMDLPPIWLEYTQRAKESQHIIFY